MAGAKRQRGEIMELPSGSLRVRVYAGVDPLTGKRHYLTETITAGRDARQFLLDAAGAVDDGVVVVAGLRVAEGDDEAGVGVDGDL
ncbi:hypothetical protein ACLMMQ_29835, partial [Bacillus mobilis]|uniref:hypothetical protein n=1 Tax=Bacillus mobilis TaxID=2026190 RepID=UPI00398D3079